MILGCVAWCCRRRARRSCCCPSSGAGLPASGRRRARTRRRTVAWSGGAGGRRGAQCRTSHRPRLRGAGRGRARRRGRGWLAERSGRRARRGTPSLRREQQPSDVGRGCRSALQGVVELGRGLDAGRGLGVARGVLLLLEMPLFTQSTRKISSAFTITFFSSPCFFSASLSPRDAIFSQTTSGLAGGLLVGAGAVAVAGSPPLDLQAVGRRRPRTTHSARALSIMGWEGGVRAGVRPPRSDRGSRGRRVRLRSWTHPE